MENEAGINVSCSGSPGYSTQRGKTHGCIDGLSGPNRAYRCSRSKVHCNDIQFIFVLRNISVNTLDLSGEEANLAQIVGNHASNKGI